MTWIRVHGDGPSDRVLEELASLQEFNHPVVSPDGDTVALYYDVDGQAILSDVSGNGRHLLDGSDEGEQMNLYRYDVESSERR